MPRTGQCGPDWLSAYKLTLRLPLSPRFAVAATKVDRRLCIEGRKHAGPKCLVSLFARGLLPLKPF